MKEVSTKQPLSAVKYALIAALGLLFGTGLTIFYVERGRALAQNGDQDRIFYLLLIPWALSCAAFLFGAMRSYARFTKKRLGGFFELGGPVVLFCLILIGGFRLVPSAPDTFDLTVRASSADAPLINSGQIVLELNSAIHHQSIGPDGEANFKGISTRLKGTTIRVLPQVEGYEQTWVTRKLDDATIDLELTKSHPVNLLTGSIIPPAIEGKQIRVIVDGQQGETMPDRYGRFQISVAGKAGDTVRLKVFIDGQLAKVDDYALPGPITIVLDKPR